MCGPARYLRMADLTNIIERRTSADAVFDALYDDIITLRLLPGTKMSEADIAAQFGVSRQPVRDAFSRLGNLGFLLIRPQKATEVKRFSTRAVTSARFIRAAIEIEVAKCALDLWTESRAPAFEENLAAQDDAVRNQDVDAFHRLDYDFHRALCDAANVPFAFDAIMENKAQIDRLCVLSMMDADAMRPLVEDHRRIYDCLRTRDPKIEDAMRVHLSRLDATIERVQQAHPDYFV